MRHGATVNLICHLLSVHVITNIPTFQFLFYQLLFFRRLHQVKPGPPRGLLWSFLWELLLRDLLPAGCLSCHPTNRVKALKNRLLSRSHSLYLCFNGHFFPAGLGYRYQNVPILDYIGAKPYDVQSSSQNVTINKPTASFYRPDALAVAQRTNRFEALKGNNFSFFFQKLTLADTE